MVFLAKGFETIEFSAFIDVMGWAKTDFDCDIETVICGLNSKVVGSFNLPSNIAWRGPSAAGKADLFPRDDFSERSHGILRIMFAKDFLASSCHKRKAGEIART